MKHSHADSKRLKTRSFFYFFSVLKASILRRRWHWCWKSDKWKRVIDSFCTIKTLWVCERHEYGQYAYSFDNDDDDINGKRDRANEISIWFSSVSVLFGVYSNEWFTQWRWRCERKRENERGGGGGGGGGGNSDGGDGGSVWYARVVCVCTWLCIGNS